MVFQTESDNAELEKHGEERKEGGGGGGRTTVEARSADSRTADSTSTAGTSMPIVPTPGLHRAIFDEFVELHGDRRFGDEPAIVCGSARFHG